MAMNPRACIGACFAALLLTGCVSTSPAAQAPAAVIANTAMRIEFDRSMRSRVVMLDAGKALALTDFSASEFVIDGDGQAIDQFEFQRHDVAQVNGPSGPGAQHTLVGLSAQGLEKTVQITFTERHPH